MAIDQFFSIHVAQTGPNKALDSKAFSASPRPGFEFLNMFFEALEEQKKETQLSPGEDKKKDEEWPGSKNPALQKDPRLDIGRLIADNPEIAEQIEQYALKGNSKLENALALNQQTFDAFLKPITTQITVSENITNSADGKTATITDLIYKETLQGDGAVEFDRLVQTLKDIENLVKNDEAGLVATNLTPQQITDLRGYVESLNNGIPAEEIEKPESLAGLGFGLVELTAPAEQQNTIVQAVAQIKDLMRGQQRNNTVDDSPVMPQASNRGGAGPEFVLNKLEQLSVRLNALNVGAGPLGDTAPLTMDGVELQNKPGLKFADYMGVIHEQAGEKAAASQADIKPAFASLPANPKAAQNSKASFSALEGWLMNTGESLWSSIRTGSGIDQTMSGLEQASGQSMTAQLTSLAMNAQSATHAHPATQMVAVNLQKMAVKGKNQNFIIQMEPPELGRVEVRMNIGKDKNVKATLIAEKPETFLMLQRDAQVLERALQEIGLDTGDGLSFELANQDQEFSHNGQHDVHTAGAQGSDTDASAELIETSLEWFVDPETGHTHYNILA